MRDRAGGPRRTLRRLRAQPDERDVPVRVEGVKVWVEVVNRKASYVATAMTGMRRLRSLPGQAA